MGLQELPPDARELFGEVTIAPHKEKGWVLELKAPLRSGERLAYDFTADGPLTFNIHSHHGKEVTHHVHVEAAKASGEFTAAEDYDFYPMWENATSAPLRLTYRLWRV